MAQDASFTKDEHVVQRAFGRAADKYILRPGAVCDPCNHFLGLQVDSRFTSRYDISLIRGLEGWAGRSGPIKEIECRELATARLDIEIKQGVAVAMYVNECVDLPGGGFRAKVRPRHPEPAVALTLRALWKIALGVMYGYLGPDCALDPQWDSLREAVLGAPFSGYLIQAPFRAIIDGEIRVNIEPQMPESPSAVMFKVGGVLLSAPLAPGTMPPDDEEMRSLKGEGWTLLTTADPPPKELFFELEPTAKARSTPSHR
ncbi:MAG TPA: hypothetical protein VGP17_13635 [Solirubrobacteraceae bacterium]|nr:hypothetical protein [Solirubrobacteraceae bacterium]